MPDKHDIQTEEFQDGLMAQDSTEKQTVDAKDLDLSAAILRNHQYDYSEADAKRVRRKIDWTLMPALCITGVLSAVDKIIISNAALYGMKTDLHLTPLQYSWVGSIVSLGFLVMEWPSSLLVQRFPLSKLLCGTVFLWAIFTMTQGAVVNFSGIMVLRVFLGMAEAPVFLILQTYVVMMYKIDEQPLRIAIFLASVATIFIGPVSYGIGVAHTPIEPWRFLYITFGGITFLWSIVLFFVLPDNPATWKLLSDKEKYIAIDRVKDNQTGIENKTIKFPLILEALLDPKNWVLLCYQVLICTYLGGLTSFAALIVNSFGFTPLHTVLLGMPTGVIQTFSSVTLSYLGTRYKNTRCITCAIACLIPIACTALIWKLDVSNRGGRLAAYYCVYLFWGCYTLSASLPAQNTSGHSKKVTTYAMTYAAYSSGTLIGPQYFKGSFDNGYIALMASAAAGAVLILLYMAICMMQNKMKDKRVARGDFDNVTYGVDESMLDMSDTQKRDFRYQY